MILWHTSPTSFTLLIVAILLAFIQPIPSIYAQSFKPVGRPQPISSYIDRQGLFIAGGEKYYSAQENLPFSDAFAIDLSVSWNASNPRFKRLPNTPPFYYNIGRWQPVRGLSQYHCLLLQFRNSKMVHPLSSSRLHC